MNNFQNYSEFKDYGRGNNRLYDDVIKIRISIKNRHSRNCNAVYLELFQDFPIISGKPSEHSIANQLNMRKYYYNWLILSVYVVQMLVVKIWVRCNNQLEKSRILFTKQLLINLHGFFFLKYDRLRLLKVPKEITDGIHHKHEAA